MVDMESSNKNPLAATVEDHPDTDDEKGDSSASKPASNSASKRTHKTSRTGRRSPSKTRPTSDFSQPVPSPPKVKDPPRPSEKPASQAGAKDEVSSEPGARHHKSRRHSQALPPLSPRKVPKEQRTRSPERNPHERQHPGPSCPCRECASAARHGHPRPGISPLQQDQRANTFPMRPKHGPPLVIRHGPPPPGHMLPPGYVVAPGIRAAYPPGGSFPVGHPPLHHGPIFDPRVQTMRPAMAPPPQPHPRMYPPSQIASMPPSLPAIRGPPSPMKMTPRPAIHHSRKTSTSSSKPFSSSKIHQDNTFLAAHHPDDEEHFSARNLPPEPHHVTGEFESDSCSSESPPDSPQYYEQSSRPYPLQRATTSTVQQVHRTGHARSRSDYPAESSYGYRSAHSSDPGWDRYLKPGYADYEDQRSHPGGRRGSNASGWTHQTSASDPVRPGYVQYAPPEHHGSYRTSEDAANMYMNQARGGPEERVTVETLHQRGNGPPSIRSNHSHRRSQHSMSETSSRYRAAEGSVKLIMPIAAAEETRIQLSGDMGDREVSFRSTDDPGKVEVTIGSVNGGERRYLQSGSHSSRPTRSSGSTRHATRGGAEGVEQTREHREHRERREHRH